MKNAIAFILVVTLRWGFSIQAQTEIQSSIVAKDKKTIDRPFEKVYLHIDRPYYSANDDIWIKAYLVDAMTNKLSDNSSNLYVELISSVSKIIKRLTLRIDKGTGFGDIHLGDSISSGTYQIRAYTNWMRNFGEVFFFKKEITIENPKEIKSPNQQIQEESYEKVDVQFFPEGGPLIENVYTLVGFKAVNS
jgi:hypothetical protein